jgi:uncharacterized protein (TIGR00106 family)
MAPAVNSFYDVCHTRVTAAHSGEFSMQATAELQVVPIGAGISVRREILRVVEILNGYAFRIETHASGTNIEGELDDILAAVQNIHVALHAEGAVRLLSYLNLQNPTIRNPLATPC